MKSTDKNYVISKLNDYGMKVYSIRALLKQTKQSMNSFTYNDIFLKLNEIRNAFNTVKDVIFDNDKFR